MKKIYAILFCLCLFSSSALSGQGIYSSAVKVVTAYAQKTDDGIIVNVGLDLSALELRRQQMVTFHVRLQSLDNKNAKTLEGIAVAGKTRYKALNRELAFGNFVFPTPVSEVLKLGQRYQLAFHFLVPYEPWMEEYDVVLVETFSGCATKCVATNTMTVVARTAPAVVAPPPPPAPTPVPVAPSPAPAFEVAYITPPAEAVKQRSETHAAMLNFVVDRYELLRDYKNNAKVLDEVDRILDELMTNPDLTITNFAVAGYASPEGYFDRNMVLSQNRALSFVNYLKYQRGFQNREISTTWYGEDWDGLYKVVAASDLPEKWQILDAISTPDVSRRKQRVQSMPVYRAILLPQIYPPLRRNEYTVAYVARAFSIEEAKVLIRTKPQHLSLNEMFLVANSYPKGSQAFKEVFDIAVRLFPDSPYARMNSAALDIENGAYDTAISRLGTLNTPEALNNMGVALAGKEDYTRALEYFRRAANAGLALADENLRKIEKWLLETER